MGRFVGAGGWIGPGSRHAGWVTRHWLHQAVTYACLGALVMFPANYLGFTTERADHHVVWSLALAVFFGVFSGLALAGMEEWARRRVEGDGG
jgi:hypothetical protein